MDTVAASGVEVALRVELEAIRNPGVDKRKDASVQERLRVWVYVELISESGISLRAPNACGY